MCSWQFFPQRREINYCLTALLIRRATAPPDLVAKELTELTFGHRQLRLVDTKGKAEQDRLSQESLEADQVIEEGVGLRVPTPHIFSQAVVVVIRRRLLHHLLDVPAFHNVVAGIGGGTFRGFTLQKGHAQSRFRARPRG